MALVLELGSEGVGFCEGDVAGGGLGQVLF